MTGNPRNAGAMVRFGALPHLLRWPAWPVWRSCAPIAAIGMAALATLAWATGMAGWQPVPFSPSLLAFALLLFVVPSFGEDSLFRWLLYPRADSTRRRALIVGSVAAFVMWHPLQAWTGIGPEWTDLFVTPGFLATVTLAGIVLAALREASGSLWPPILFHWVIVCGWKFFGGGPF